jgi:hypothetical protein
MSFDSGFISLHFFLLGTPWFRHMKPSETFHAFDSVAFGLLEANLWFERLCLLQLWCVESACGEGVAF